MKFARSALAALFLCGAAMPALAQETGSHIKRRSDPAHNLDSRSGDRGRRALDDLAACMASKDTLKARNTVSYPLGSAEQDEYMQRTLLGASECMHQGYILRVSTAGLAAALAENLVQMDLSLRRGTSVGAEVKDIALPAVQPLATSESYGLCVTYRDAAGAQRLIQTVPGEKEEMDAIRAMLPALSACVPAGTQFEADPMVLRSTIAVGLYRIVRASEDGAPLSDAPPSD